MYKAIAPLRGLAVATVLAVTTFSAMAEYPDHPLRIIVPFAAGGATDVIARTVAQAMSARLGQSVVVENKAGANGNIGAVSAARADADGYTLLMATSSHAINASLYQKLNYSLTRDFVGLSNLASVPLLLVVNPSVPVNSAAELAAYAKSNAGRVNYASGGTGTASHLAGEQFSTLAGTKMTHVAYKGRVPGAPYDVMGGQVQVMFANLPEVLAQVQSGSSRRSRSRAASATPRCPMVPAFSETPFPGMTARALGSAFVRAGRHAEGRRREALASDRPERGRPRREGSAR